MKRRDFSQLRFEEKESRMAKTKKFLLLLLLLLPAVSTAVETKTFWALTDVHISDDYVAGSAPKTFCTSGSGSAGKFGTFNCDSPQPTLVASAFEFMKQNPADGVFWLGDSPTQFARFYFYYFYLFTLTEQLLKVR